MAYDKPTSFIFLDKRRVKTNGKYPVKLVVDYARERKTYKTKEELTQDDWDKIHTGAKIKLEELKNTKTKLSYYIGDKFNNALKEIERTDKPFSFQLFEKFYFGDNKSAKSNFSVFDAIERKISSLEAAGRIGTAVSCKSLKNSLKLYVDKLNFKDITPEFLRSYEQHMLKEKKSITTVGIYMRELRAIVNEAMNDPEHRVNGNKLAVLGEDVSRKQQLLTSTEVLVHTEELYWTLISLREKQKTLTSYQALLDTLCRDVNNFQRAGLAQRNDLLKVQLKQNELKVNLLRLNNGIDLTTMALCQHIGLSYDTTLVFNTQPETPISKPELVDAQNTVTNRVEYQLLNRAIEAEELQRKMTMGEYMPQLSVSALGVYVDVANSSQKNGLAMVNLSIPISDWWGGSHKIKQQRMKIEKAKSTLSETAELLVLQVEQVNKDLHESWFQVQVSKKSVEQARENLKVTEDNYHVGTIGISDLLEAQAIFQEAKDNLTEAQCNYQIKMAKYLQAINSYK